MEMKTQETSQETKDMETRHHTHLVQPNQCSSTVVQVIDAPLQLVWGLVREFSNPQAYKLFVKSCEMVNGNGEDEGSVREVKVMSGLPAERSMERLVRLDDELHLMAFTIIGGDHRLSNYQSTTTVHEEEVFVAAAAAAAAADNDGRMMRPPVMRTVVIESYVVDVPTDNSSEEASCFAETIIGCNLRSLATASLLMHRR